MVHLYILYTLFIWLFHLKKMYLTLTTLGLSILLNVLIVDVLYCLLYSDRDTVFQLAWAGKTSYCSILGEVECRSVSLSLRKHILLKEHVIVVRFRHLWILNIMFKAKNRSQWNCEFFMSGGQSNPNKIQLLLSSLHWRELCQSEVNLIKWFSVNETSH